MYFSFVNFAGIPWVAGSPALRIRLCADEVSIITTYPRTGQITLWDSGDLAGAGRGPQFIAISTKMNENLTPPFAR